MLYFITIPFIVVSLFFTSSVAADADARYDAVKALGRLNGIALQCKYVDQVSRMKEAVVMTVPKERSFGLAFDQAANDSFLVFIQEQSPCPGPAGFEKDVTQQIELLQQLFKNH
ncbi:MAG TPA: hypothetical protein DDW45_07535 [Gammaproteobacteria bacterium]|nr:hypothetical protein [Gammaproteobacteria bacterium]